MVGSQGNVRALFWQWLKEQLEEQRDIMATHKPTLRESKELMKDRGRGGREREREREMEGEREHTAREHHDPPMHENQVFSVYTMIARNSVIMNNYKHACYYGQRGQATQAVPLSL